MNLKTLIAENEIRNRITELAKDISLAFNNESIIIVCLLKGAFIFTADLVKELKNEVSIEFMRIKSYDGTTKGEDKLIYDIEEEITGKNVLIVDDILDTGNCLKFAFNIIKNRNPKTLKTCVLLEKERKSNFASDFTGFKIPDEFVVGYGLDLNELYRNLPYIAVIKE